MTTTVTEMSMAVAQLQAKGVTNIAISSVTPQFGLKEKIANLNEDYQKLCKDMNVSYIDNSGSIWYSRHVSSDNIHLNPEGVNVLEGNYAKYIKSCEIKR